MSTVATPNLTFENVTQQRGLYEPLLRWEFGHAAAWGDITGNGYPDLYVGAFADRDCFTWSTAPKPNMLFLNNGERFEQVECSPVEFQGLKARTSMSLFVDLTNNGVLDLVVSNHGYPGSRLFRQRSGQWEDVTPTRGDWPTFAARNVVPLDLDGNGLLDLLVCEGTYGGRKAHLAARSVLLRNRGDYTFEDVTELYGLPSSGTRGLGVAVGDLTGNGRMDLFIAHCNRLFIAGDDGRYTECPLPIDRVWSGWPCGAVFGDLTGDGRLDLVLTDHGLPPHVVVMLNRGLDVEGHPVFEDVTEECGLDLPFDRKGKTGVPFKAAAFSLVDVDNNGRQDVLMGMVYEHPDLGLQPVVFHNQGLCNGVPRFSTPPVEELVGYSAASPMVDLDRDGRTAMFFATWFRAVGNHLFVGPAQVGNYLDVLVKGNAMGVGSTVRLYRCGTRDLLGRQDITLGSVYSSGSEPVAHFGLGQVAQCDVEVVQRDRRVNLSNVTANQRLALDL